MMGRGLAVIVGILIAGCASNDRISLVQGESQQSLTRDGRGTLISAKRNVVMLQPAASEVRSSSRPAFVVAVLNRSKGTLDLKVSGITAQHLDQRSAATSLHVYSYEELVAEERRRQTWAAVGAALQSASASMSAASAGYVRTSGTYSGSSYGTYYGGLNGTYTGSTMGTYSATTYDAGRAYAAQQHVAAQSAANFAAIEESGERNLSRLQNTILKDNTVMPGEWIGGLVIVDTPSKGKDGVAKYRVNVQFGDELHSFEIAQAAAG